VTTTLSPAQRRVARRRVRDAGLERRVTVLDRDYRELRGRFDKLVTIEMIEAVGHDHYDEFFRVCARRLAPDGLMLMQAITVPEQRYEAARKLIDFIRLYVFPGSNCPSIGALLAAAGRASDLQLVHLEDLTPHYARTLRCWLDNLRRGRDAARALGYDDRFLRTWEYYLSYSGAGFAERYIGSAQMLWARSGYRGQPSLSPLPEPG